MVAVENNKRFPGHLCVIKHCSSDLAASFVILNEKCMLGGSLWAKGSKGAKPNA